jgi:hypothetical protein
MPIYLFGLHLICIHKTAKSMSNRTSVTEGTGRTANWTYDKIYRLTNETIGADPANKDGSVGYVLDPVGNRKSSTSTLSGVNPESFTFTADDELTTITTATRPAPARIASRMTRRTS